MSRLREQRGFTLIEVLVSMTLLAGGIFALMTTFDFSRRLTTNGEKLDSAAQVAQQEVEKVISLPYSQIALSAMPSCDTSDTTNPNYYARPCPSPTSFGWKGDTTNLETLCGQGSSDGTCNSGSVAPGPTAWQSPDGRLRGSIYRYVSWIGESGSACAGACTGSSDYKRVTVMVTITGADAPKKPIKISTIAVDPCVGPGSAVRCRS